MKRGPRILVCSLWEVFVGFQLGRCRMIGGFSIMHLYICTKMPQRSYACDSYIYLPPNRSSFHLLSFLPSFSIRIRIPYTTHSHPSPFRTPFHPPTIAVQFPSQREKSKPKKNPHPVHLSHGSLHSSPSPSNTLFSASSHVVHLVPSSLHPSRSTQMPDPRSRTPLLSNFQFFTCLL